MIDWHSHILPAVDDGSRSLEESLAMLKELQDQGVKVVVATPHFWADEESVDEFLERRQQAYDLLQSNMADMGIKVICGAEVRYYPGISRMQDLGKLVIQDTRLLLLEMPMTRWTEFTVRELKELASMRGLKIVLAHFERYIALQDRGLAEKLCEKGILIQVNAGAFEHLGGRRKAVKLLDAGCVHFVGSDCHNLTSRPPKIAPAYELIRKKFGSEFTAEMLRYGHCVLEKYAKR